MFERRPEVENLTRHDGTANTTWSQMTQSLGEAFDLRKAGRTVDTNLLHELSRHERDPMPQRVAAAELAAMGAIDSRAMEQITNNTNFEGWKLPVEDRLAFALLMNAPGSPRPIERFPMNSGKPTFEVVATVLGKPAGGEWLATARTQAKALLAASQSNTLLESPAYATLIKGRLADGGAGLPASLSNSPRALLAFDIASKSGATPEQAMALAEQSAAGQLDVVTLQALAPSAAWNSHIVFAEQFARNALAPKISLDEASQIATSVAKGELGFGQLHGFMLAYGASDDSPKALLTVPLAAELVVAVNKGELAEAGLAKALDAGQYFPSALSNRIWDHFFSGKDANGGNKYTVSGIAPDSTYVAPLMRKLDAELVKGLAGSEAQRETFARAFQEKIAEGLPRGLGVRWDRLNGDEGDEVRRYAQLVDGAVAHARSAAGI
jgi:hypothetical protein